MPPWRMALPRRCRDRPPLPPEAINSALHRLQRMMAAAQRHAVGWIEGRATISKLNHMIGEEAIIRLGFDAASPTLDPFTAMASALNDGGSPCPVLGRRIDGVGGLARRLYAAAIRRRNARRRDFDARHR